MAKNRYKDKILIWKDGTRAMLTKNKRLLVRDRVGGGCSVFMRHLLTKEQEEERQQQNKKRVITCCNVNYKKAGQHVVETEIWLTEETAKNLMRVLYSYLDNKHKQKQLADRAPTTRQNHPKI